MLVTVTSSRVSKKQLPKVENFLEAFLPRMRHFPGVVALYHDASPKQCHQGTVVVWENESAFQAYRASDLVQEAIAFEKKMKYTKQPASAPFIAGLLASVEQVIANDR
jgi:heme-degrading monooxygenase HmoA